MTQIDNRLIANIGRTAGAGLANFGKQVQQNRLLKAEQTRQAEQDRITAEDRAFNRNRLLRSDQIAEHKFGEEFENGVIAELASTNDISRQRAILEKAAQQASALQIDPSEFQQGVQLLKSDPENFQAGVISARDALISQGRLTGPKQATPTNIEKLLDAEQEAIAAGNTARAQTLRAAITKATTRAQGASLSVDSNGNIVFTQGGEPVPQKLGNPSELNKKISGEDAKQVAASQEASDAAQATNDLLSRAKEILPQIQTGKFSGSDTTLGLLQALSDVGIAEAKEQTALLEEFDSITKELGAQALQLFGGSDTEKELEVAIRTNPERTKDEKSNKNIIERKLRAINVIQQRPDFEAAWLQRNDSLKNPDSQTGEYFGKAWRRYQRETAPDLFQGGEKQSVGRFQIEVVE